MARLPPDPRIGLTAATSGVWHPQPNCVNPEGSAKLLEPCPSGSVGFMKLGWFKTLKNSARNCEDKRSLNFQDFTMDKSMFRNPESRNMLRPIVPNVPRAGGIITEFFRAKHPKLLRDVTVAALTELAALKHA